MRTTIPTRRIWVVHYVRRMHTNICLSLFGGVLMLKRFQKKTPLSEPVVGRDLATIVFALCFGCFAPMLALTFTDWSPLVKSSVAICAFVVCMTAAIYYIRSRTLNSAKAQETCSDAESPPR